ncbi:MAG: outer membrane beta-barrel protein [Cytophagaceae bacterium]|nr:outer membrane beta-barrel protein [Cytophagaceae bacterium]
MKKLYITFILAVVSMCSMAQVKIGLRLSPAFCINSVKDIKSTDGVEFENNGSKMRLSIGPSFDFKLSENAEFSLGLWYMSYRAGLTSTTSFFSIETKESVSLQSLQIPVTFKVYTNEIATDLKIYFQFGAQVNFSFYEKFLENKSSSTILDYEKHYSFYDVALYTGAGVTYAVGETNELFAGLYYNRGFTNIMNNNDVFNYKDGIRYNMHLIGLEMGIRF